MDKKTLTELSQELLQRYFDKSYQHFWSDDITQRQANNRAKGMDRAHNKLKYPKRYDNHRVSAVKKNVRGRGDTPEHKARRERDALVSSTRKLKVAARGIKQYSPRSAEADERRKKFRVVGESNMSNLKDAVIAGLDQKFDTMRTLVHASLNEKAVAALDGVKREIASSLFSGVGSQDSPLSEGRVGDNVKGFVAGLAGVRQQQQMPVVVKKKKKIEGNTEQEKKAAQPVKESTQLQELSAKKLHKYVNRAARSERDLEDDADGFEAAAERREKASGQVARFKTYYGAASDYREKAAESRKKAQKRSAFTQKAMERLGEAEDMGKKKDFKLYNDRTDDDVGMHGQKKGVKKDKPNYTKGIKDIEVAKDRGKVEDPNLE